MPCWRARWGAYGLISLFTMSAENKKIFQNYGNSQGYIGYVLKEFDKQREYLNEVLTNPATDSITLAKQRIDSSDVALLNNLNKYENTRTTEKEIENFELLKETMEAYRTTRDTMLQKGIEGDFETMLLLSKASNTKITIENAKSQIDIEIAANSKAAEDAIKRQESSTLIALIIMGVVMAAAVTIAVLLGLLIRRSIMKPLMIASGRLENLAKGRNFDALDLKDFSGEFRVIAENLNEVRLASERLIVDIQMLVEAAVEGRLSTRADVEKHVGNYRMMIEGINKTLDAVTEPISEATEVLKEVAQGNLKVLMQGEYKGEHAVIKNSLNATIESLRGYIQQITDVLEQFEKGDLSVSIYADFRGDFVALKESINSIISTMNSMIIEINAAAEQVSSGTRQVSDGSQTVSQGATEQASSIEELTASISEIAAQTKHNALNANKADQLANSARDDAAKGNEQMKLMQNAMRDISESSSNISKIIKVIDDIAFQTNILALNAAVEAARAGANGKGFAVVADEVRNLAAKSANAAKETEALIQETIKKVEVGSKLADSTAASLENIVDGSTKTVQLVSEIAQSSNDQATAISQVNRGIEQMSLVVQNNSATSEETAAAAEELSSQAEMLKLMVAHFKTRAAVKEPNTAVPKEQTKKQEKDVAALNDSEFGKY